MLSKLPKKSFAQDPIHQQLADLCRQAIEQGDYGPGERFASERELAERFEVSRATANKVISALVTGGLLEVKKGLGTRVINRPTLFASLGGMNSFTEAARAQGHEPSTEVLVFRRLKGRAVPKRVREGLETDSVFYLERLRLADGIPMILEYRWVAEALASGLAAADVSDSFYHLLERKFGLMMTGERHTISAVVVDAEQQRLFRSDGPMPALLVEGVGFVKKRTPLWYQRLYYHGEHYELQNETRGVASSEVALKLTN